MSSTCAGYASECGDCWYAGCRYCEVGPIPWERGSNGAAVQGDALDYVCVANDDPDACQQVTVQRINTAYSATFPQERCASLDPVPTAAPTSAVVAAVLEAANDQDEDGFFPGDSPVAIALIISALVIISFMAAILGRLLYLRRVRSRRVHVAYDENGTAPAPKTAFMLPPTGAQVTASMAVANGLFDSSPADDGAMLWNFSGRGQLPPSTFEQILVALAAEEAADMKGRKFAKPQRRCLVFGRGNGLRAEQLVVAGKLLDKHPSVALSLDPDWEQATDAELRELAALLRRRGRCVLRATETGVPGQMYLPRNASPAVLMAVAEAVGVADHKEVSGFVLDSAAGAPTLSLGSLRLSATELVQTSNRILGDSGCALACGFVTSYGARLQVLKLADCNIGDAGCASVARLAGGLAGPSLRELNLSSNRVGDKGALSIADALPTCDMLERIVLDRNDIGKKGAEALAKRLPRSEVRDLVLGSHLGGNPRIGDAGGEALAAALDDRMPRLAANRATRLQYLSLECCGIGDKGAMAIARMLPQSAIVTLSLARGEMTDVAAMALFIALPPTVEALDLTGNLLSDDAGTAIGDMLHKKPKLAVSLAQNRVSSMMQTLLQEEHGARLRM